MIRGQRNRDGKWFIICIQNSSETAQVILRAQTPRRQRISYKKQRQQKYICMATAVSTFKERGGTYRARVVVAVSPELAEDDGDDEEDEDGDDGDGDYPVGSHPGLR